MALSDFYSAHRNYTTKLVLHVSDSRGNVIDAATSALSLLKDERVDAIIGPQKSVQANFVMDLGERAHVPIISFSATSPSLLPQPPNYFLQTAQSDDTQVGAIAAIIKSFQWKDIVMIFEDTVYGKGIVPYLANALQDIDARFSYRSVFPLSASDDFILKELYKMMTMQTRVFVVQLSHSLAARLFLNAKEIGMMNKGYAWILTSGLTDIYTSMEPNVKEAMQGVLGVKHQIPQPVKQGKTSIVGIWAYDTLWALAMAAEKVGVKEPVAFDTTRTMNSTNVFSFKTSQTGPKLLKAMLETRFKGLGGDFRLIKGRVLPSPFQIINVIEKEEEIGIWTLSQGILWKTSNSTSTKNLRGIIWPGESDDDPKGWEVPTSGKKLRIGVPVKSGFTEFVKVDWDPRTNLPNVSGYAIKVFESVMKALPYDVPREYVPFVKTDYTSGGSYYNDLVYQVYLQKLDAAAGDITITANRSLYVDFTLPYAEGGVSMVVPVSYEDGNNKWTFLKPLRRDLWVTSIGFFILTGFAVWVLEHRINVAFRGPPSQHVGMMLWFPFSTLVFPRGSPLVSDVSRAIIKIIEGNMSGYIPTCTGPKNTVASNNIRLESFAGLFGITGGVTVTCLLLFLVIYLLKNKDLLQRSSLWLSLCAMCKHFDQRDVSSYPFSRNNDSQDLELQDISVSSHFGGSPALPRSSHSSDSRTEVEGRDVNDETIHCSSEDILRKKEGQKMTAPMEMLCNNGLKGNV
ncbi:hypothetical protein RJ640_008302 [Escallonia rubra]|uniref:Ionotropic glutamate receptor C-terminal domain-containing protein n=1 Tax=Escallonia rubra TaxID=112253 RepID=A0AA88UC83_9ASTE|nr:hypothetical protein RJ640_008302 [Escallonia rubra]